MANPSIENSAQERAPEQNGLSVGWLLGAFLVATLCVLVAGVGLWAAGRFAGVGPLAPVPSSPPVAVVNGETITLHQLDNLVALNVAMAPLQTGQAMNVTPAQWQQLRNQLLNQMIRNTIVLQEARKAGITVTDAQVDAELQAMLDRYGITLEQLDAQLAQAGIQREVLREWLRGALIATTYLRQYVYVGVTEEEQQKQAYERWIQERINNSQIQVLQQP